MTVGQIILVIFTLGLTVGTYVFGPITDPKKSPTEMMSKPSESKQFDFDSYQKTLLSKLDKDIQTEITSILDSYKVANDDGKLSLLQNIVDQLSQNGLKALAAIYEKKIAEIDTSEETLIKAGDQLTDVLYSESNPDLQQYMLTEAQQCYKKALEINPSSVDTKIKLASSYMDGTNQVMEGVSMLLEITKQDPDNLSANLILGRYGIISGQYDKAKGRLEKVIQKDPLNAEAYFYLAEAYNGLGDKAKAIELFEKCKTLVSNPDFSKEVDDYIEKLKNS